MYSHISQMFLTLEVKYIETIEKLLLFSTIFCYLLIDFHDKTGTRFSLRDKRLFEISDVEITRGNCIAYFKLNFG